MNNNLLNRISEFNGLSSIIQIIDNKKIIKTKDIDFIEDIIKKENPKDLDNIMYNIMLEIIKYNNDTLGLSDEKLEEVTNEIKEEKNLKWSDILNYLDLNIEFVNSDLRLEMEKISNLKSIEETARFIKNSKRAENRIINKINDVNIVISILLYSNKKYISNIISYFKNEDEIDGRALGKAIEAIPSIFLVNTPDYIPSNYDLFIKNYNLLKDEGINVRNIIINKPILMISFDLENLINSIKGVF